MSHQGMLALRILAVAVLIAFVTKTGAEIVRSQEQIRGRSVQGVNLSMTPRQAFEALVERGYSAGKIKLFEDWRSGGIQMVRGGGGRPAWRIICSAKLNSWATHQHQ